MEKISIVVPVYNVKKYLHTCIESLLCQSYENIEIILVDDGSTDESGLICDEYASLDSRVIVIHKENGGLSDARNVGIDKSTGEYITFVDSDDYVSYEYINVLYSEVKMSDCDIVECNYAKVYENDDYQIKSIEEGETRELSYLEWLTETKHNGFVSVVVWNKIYPKELFCDIRFPVGRLYEDDSTTYKLIYKAKKIKRIYKRLYYYRQRSTSITGTNLSEKKIRDNIVALEEQIEFFTNNNEIQIADFARSKLCLLLISYYIKLKNDSEIAASIDKKSIMGNLIETFNSISDMSNVPKKYLLYIRLFLVNPSIFSLIFKKVL